MKKTIIRAFSFISALSLVSTGKGVQAAELTFSPGYVPPSEDVGFINDTKVVARPFRLSISDSYAGRNLFATKLNEYVQLQNPLGRGFRFSPAQPAYNGSSASVIGLFDVSEYFVCAPQTPCAQKQDLGEPGAALTGGAGGGIVFTYIPYEGPLGDNDNYKDPYPEGIFDSSLYWIQTVKYQNAFLFEPEIIDFTTNFPFYSTLGVERTEFYDRSYRKGNFPYLARGQNTWQAEVHLAKRTGADRDGNLLFDIYDGLRWAWDATLTGNPPCELECKEDSPPPPELPEIPSVLKTFSVYEPISYNAPLRTIISNVDFVEGSWNAFFGNSPLDPQACLSLSPLDSGKRLFAEFDSLYYDNSGPGCTYEISLLNQGLSQYNPVFPDSEDDGWKNFYQAPSGLWYDPPTKNGLEFQALGDTLFTDIYDFPTGLDIDELFTVSVNDTVLGKFSPGERLNFITLLGGGVSGFNITGIDSRFGDKAIDYPFRLAFNKPEGDFRVRAFEDAKSTPEPSSIPEPSSAFAIATIGAISFLSKRKK